MKKIIAAFLLCSVTYIVMTTSCFAGGSQICDYGKPETTPIYFFEVNKTDGTVFDKTSNLTWKICTEGQRYADGQCMGKISEFAWEEAMQRFAEKEDGWRIPNIIELKSIVEVRGHNPTMNEGSLSEWAYQVCLVII